MNVSVQLLNLNMKRNINKNDYLNILSQIRNKPESSQRDLAKELGLSLGKINYCIKALKNKGLIKINNFRNNNYKLSYLYILTPKGIKHKTNLTLRFMKLKMKEYDELNKEFIKEKKRKIFKE